MTRLVRLDQLNNIKRNDQNTWIWLKTIICRQNTLIMLEQILFNFGFMLQTTSPWSTKYRVKVIHDPVIEISSCVAHAYSTHMHTQTHSSKSPQQHLWLKPEWTLVHKLCTVHDGMLLTTSVFLWVAYYRTLTLTTFLKCPLLKYVINNTKISQCGNKTDTPVVKALIKKTNEMSLKLKYW